MAELIAQQTFGPAETLVLDGQEFSDCEFRQTKLVYEGGALPSFQNCQFHGVNWHLEGAADRTLAFVRFLFTTGNTTLMDAILKNLRGETQQTYGQHDYVAKLLERGNDER